MEDMAGPGSRRQQQGRNWPSVTAVLWLPNECSSSPCPLPPLPPPVPELLLRRVFVCSRKCGYGLARARLAGGRFCLRREREKESRWWRREGWDGLWPPLLSPRRGEGETRWLRRALPLPSLLKSWLGLDHGSFHMAQAIFACTPPGFSLFSQRTGPSGTQPPPGRAAGDTWPPLVVPRTLF